MIIAGIDPGSNLTGYSIVQIQPRRLSVLEYGVIRSKPREKLPEKLLRIYRSLNRIFTEYRPEHLALESAFVAKYPQAALVLGHTRGAIMVAAHALQLEIFEYSPRLVKKAVAGIGRASKRQVGEMVQRHFSLSKVPTPADTADALAVAYCHLLQQKLF